MLALALPATSAEGAGSAANTSLFWASGPVAPNETLLVAGSGFPSSPIVIHVRYDGKSSAAPVVIKPAKVSTASVVFTLPATMDLAAYLVQVCDEDTPTACSDALPVNRAELWWASGDAGNRSTAGGWVRLFGIGLDLAVQASSGSRQGEIQQLEEQLQHALRSRDVVGIETLALELSALLGGRSQQLADGARTVAELQLQRVAASTFTAGTAVVVPAVNGSLWDATFRLPPTLEPGVYRISARNQYQATWTPLDAFGGQHNPHSQTIEVLPKLRNSTVFAVADYMQQCGVPIGGLNFSTGAPVVSTPPHFKI